MLNLKRLPLLVIVICAIVIPISILTFAHELPYKDITTSYGSTHRIRSYSDSYTAHTAHEGKLTTAKVDLAHLIYEKEIIQKGLDGDRSGLSEAARGAGIPMIMGKRPDVNAVITLASKILKWYDDGNTYEIGLEKISKYSEIDSKNGDIANAYADRELFYAEYGKRWTHSWVDRGVTNNPVPPRTNTGTLASMQEFIPRLGAECANNCGAFWYDFRQGEYYSGFAGGNPTSLDMIPSDARRSHKKKCNVTPHSNYEYYSCPAHGYPGCDKADEHHLACLGGCGNKGAPEWALVNRYGKMTNLRTTKPLITMLLHENVTISAHKTRCTENVSNGWGGTTRCSYYYYTCQTSNACPNANNHVTGSGSDAAHNPSDSTPSPPTTPSTPSYHACGVHEDWQSGDHSAAACGVSTHIACDGLNHQQVQCTSTNANGDQCTHTYWACKHPAGGSSHNHVYPAPPEPDPEPEGATCANGHSYDPNNPLEANAHRTRTCRYSRCGNSWPECSNNPLCNDPRRKALGKYCWPE